MNQYTTEEQDQQKVNESEVAYDVRTAPVFTGYQMQILESIANVKDERDMMEIRNLIAEYFSNKALDAMDKLCDEGSLSVQTIESWQKAERTEELLRANHTSKASSTLCHLVVPNVAGSEIAVKDTVERMH